MLFSALRDGMAKFPQYVFRHLFQEKLSVLQGLSHCVEIPSRKSHLRKYVPFYCKVELNKNIIFLKC